MNTRILLVYLIKRELTITRRQNEKMLIISIYRIIIKTNLTIDNFLLSIVRK